MKQYIEMRPHYPDGAIGAWENWSDAFEHELPLIDALKSQLNDEDSMLVPDLVESSDGSVTLPLQWCCAEFRWTPST